jgi:uncharacterized protein (TIGR03118 family)
MLRSPSIGKPFSHRPVLEHLENRCLPAGGFGLVNLASDVPGLARVTAPQLVNPWGIAFSPDGPFWFADNGSGVSDVLDGRGLSLPLIVSVPSTVSATAAPTGAVFNGGGGFGISENGRFAPSRFLFASTDGSIAGWNTEVDPTRAIPVVDDSAAGAVFTGLALASDGTRASLLYAADFGRGTIDVFDEDFRQVVRPGLFQDANLPDGYSPFNVQSIDDLLFVTYAKRAPNGSNDLPGPGNGVIDIYDTTGDLIRRFSSGGELNSPWGLTLAPEQFGRFGGALLVGNNGDGRINAYNRVSGAFLGQLNDDTGRPLMVPDLWALTFGNGHAAGDANTLFFAAGLENEAHGLFGAIQAPDQRGADTAGSGNYVGETAGEFDVYPLPPAGGPAFRVNNAGQSFLMAELLPLTESSLALVPTLIAVSGPAATGESPGIVPTAAFSTSGPVLMGGTSIPAAEPANLGPGTRQDATIVDTYLDRETSGIDPLRKVVVSCQVPDSTGVTLPAVTDLTGAMNGIPTRGTSNAHDGPSAPLRSGQTNVEFSPGALGSCDTILSRASDEAGADWKTLANACLAVSIPMLGTYWASHVWSRRSILHTKHVELDDD